MAESIITVEIKATDIDWVKDLICLLKDNLNDLPEPVIDFIEDKLKELDQDGED